MLHQAIAHHVPDQPPHWSDYVVDQQWGRVSDDDHAVWDLLFTRQVELLGTRVVTPFLDGLDLLALSKPGVPELGELNRQLEPRTGWRTVAVEGLVPDDAFFAMLTERVFPIGNFIRRRAELDYLEEPDCFHDIFGHVPMIADADMARLMEQVGRLGTAAIAAGRGDEMARLYWHSAEFGLALEGGEMKILGAGLASSFGEAHFSLESETVQRRRFEVSAAMATPYKHDSFQRLYMVSDSLAATSVAICALDPAMFSASA